MRNNINLQPAGADLYKVISGEANQVIKQNELLDAELMDVYRTGEELNRNPERKICLQFSNTLVTN